MTKKKTRQQAEEKLVKVDQNPNDDRSMSSNNSASQLCNSAKMAAPRPVSGGEQEILTLLNKYDAKLHDRAITDLVLPFDSEKDPPIIEGEVILYKEMLKRVHQVRPVTVRLLPADIYEVLEGDSQLLALEELGATSASCIVVNCKDQEAQEIRELLNQNRQQIPLSVSLKACTKVKEAVKEKRTELKKSGKKNLPTTNEMVAEVLGISETYTKQLLKLAQRPDCDSLAKKLGNGESLGAVTKTITGNGRVKGVQAPKEPSEVVVPEGFDTKAFCPDCPNLRRFQDELKAMRKSQTKQ